MIYIVKIIYFFFCAARRPSNNIYSVPDNYLIPMIQSV